MAANGNAEIDKLLQCGICHANFKDPRLLVCGHQFCLECLSNVLEEEDEDEDEDHPYLKCALCRDVTRVPEGNIYALQQPSVLQRQLTQFVLMKTEVPRDRLAENAEENLQPAEPEALPEPCEGYTVVQRMKFKVTVFAMAYDSKLDKLVVGVDNKHGPIHIYNTDDWSRKAEFGGNLKYVPIADRTPEYDDQCDIAVDTKRGKYILNCWPDHPKWISSNSQEIGTIGTNGRVVSIAYIPEEDAFVSIQWVEMSSAFCTSATHPKYQSFIMVSRATDWKMQQKIKLLDDKCIGYKVRFATIDKLANICVSQADSVQFYSMDGRHRGSYSRYQTIDATIDGGERSLTRPSSVVVNSHGRVVLVDKGSTCLVGFWSDARCFHTEELPVSHAGEGFQNGVSEISIDGKDNAYVMSRNGDVIYVLKDSFTYKPEPESPPSSSCVCNIL